jgi:hypothetical protein
MTMIELKIGVPTDSFLRQLPEIRQSVANSGTPMTWQDGQGYYLRAVERLEVVFSHSFLEVAWHERLYSSGYWAVREMSEGVIRPLPLLQAEASRLVRWLDDIEHELKRIAEQDEWDKESIPRLLFDTSALVREGSFDTFDWRKLANSSNGRVRLIVPILVVREMDDLKNFGKTSKARPRLRKIFQILDNHGRGPATVSDGATLELLMDPPGHLRLTSHDEEIVRRATYLNGRQGGPLKIVSGDYTMLATAQAEGIAAVLTPAELTMATEG